MPGCAHSYEALVAALRDHGVRYLTPTDARPARREISPSELIACLAAHDEARLRLALIPLFILNPEFAELVASLEPSWPLQKLYTAAVCLQRMWTVRLGFYLDEVRLLPDLFTAALDLPPVEEHDGKLCLYELAARERFNQLSAYEGVMELLFAQLMLEARREPAAAS